MRISKIFAIIYFLVGLYLVNMAFDLITLPESIIVINKWVLVIAGILVFIAGVKIFFKKRNALSSLSPLP